MGMRCFLCEDAAGAFTRPTCPLHSAAPQGNQETRLDERTPPLSQEHSNTPRRHTCVLQGFEKTGLGERIANIFVQAMGKSTLGLSMGLLAAESFLAPAMPSTSARAGGIFMPIIKARKCERAFHGVCVGMSRRWNPHAHS